MLFKLAAEASAEEKEDRRNRLASAAGLSAGLSALDQNKGITSALNRCQKILAQELNRIGDVGEMLQTDKQTIADTKGQYSSHADKVGTSKEHLSNLKRQERNDRIMIGAALCFFAVVVHIVSKRFRLGALVPFGSYFGL